MSNLLINMDKFKAVVASGGRGLKQMTTSSYEEEGSPEPVICIFCVLCVWGNEKIDALQYWVGIAQVSKGTSQELFLADRGMCGMVRQDMEEPSANQ
ncbi:unnamed protein product [Darwinula stevensoni]|uniref:Uncharacterized protein n=1 Tax=Darwinula stevensoni TaxID=69355 RepID=A0A7R8XD04_9CRUS|nr:unnamed protein product [Darwinula stevensoni]CAG0888262.1 unnamed protein product [Darwinula stevensoni]